jgi:hypothetical protein
MSKADGTFIAGYLKVLDYGRVVPPITILLRGCRPQHERVWQRRITTLSHSCHGNQQKSRRSMMHCTQKQIYILNTENKNMGAMNETESELTGQKETLEEWVDGYNCGIQHADSYRNRMQLALVIAFAIGILIGVNV